MSGPLSTPTLIVPSRNMPTASPATHSNSDGEQGSPGKYTTSPSFASVVSSSAGSSSAISSHSAPLGSTTTISSSLAPQQQNLYQQHQKHEHGQTSPPSAANYNSIKNSASLPATSTSQSNRSPAHPSSSTYGSALASPASRSYQSSNGSTGPDQASSNSSDVEIYLNTLVLHDSVSRMQGTYITVLGVFFFSFLFWLSPSASADLVLTVS